MDPLEGYMSRIGPDHQGANGQVHTVVRYSDAADQRWLAAATSTRVPTACLSWASRQEAARRATHVPQATAIKGQSR